MGGSRLGLAVLTAAALACGAGVPAALASQPPAPAATTAPAAPPLPTKEKAPGAPVQTTALQTNLANEDTLTATLAALRRAGVSEPRLRVFREHVTQFNTAVGTKALAGRPIPLGTQKWDPYVLQDAWAAKHPDFLGYNCRITSFGLYGDFLTVDTRKPARSTLLFMEHEALEKDPSALFGKNGAARFDRLWSTVPTTGSKDVATQVAALQRDWAARGISFSPRTDIRLISVVLHDTIDKPQLFVGHTGILLPQRGGGLIFVEKLAFQAPYQVTTFRTRVELESYLMNLYDDGNTDSARTFIMENGQRMRRL